MPPMNDDRDSNFLSRWSRRKAQVREGVAAPGDGPIAPALPALADAAPGAPQAVPATRPPQDGRATQPAVAPPSPTLADVAALSAQSDYSRFVAEGVAPEVKNAALKKLFTDPHFNVMDGLDTYIDDYGKPDPLPAGMLRKMVQSRLMGLFDDEAKAGASAAGAASNPAEGAADAPDGRPMADDPTGAPPVAADGDAPH
jgi:Protein of unknown function (DUF3306)